MVVWLLKQELDPSSDPAQVKWRPPRGCSRADKSRSTIKESRGSWFVSMVAMLLYKHLDPRFLSRTERKEGEGSCGGAIKRARQNRIGARLSRFLPQPSLPLHQDFDYRIPGTRSSTDMVIWATVAILEGLCSGYERKMNGVEVSPPAAGHG